MKAAESSRRFHFSDLITAVCLQEGIAQEFLLSSKKNVSLILARGRLYYMAYNELNLSSGIIARLCKKKTSHQVSMPVKRYQLIANDPLEILTRENIKTVAELLYKKELSLSSTQNFITDTILSRAGRYINDT
tara:strand:- start:166 stop:564 length:399 start_codon:yes stop_codon:yes gene_type:complete